MMLRRPSALRHACLVLLGGWLYCLGSQAEPLRVGYFAIPPHTSPGPHGEAGPAFDYFGRIAAKMAVSPTYIQQPLSRLLASLANGQLDAVLILARNPARSAQFRYPDTPFFDTTPTLAVRHDGPPGSASERLRSNRLRIGYWQQGFLTPSVAGTRNRLIPIAGEDVLNRGIEMLLAGRLDAFFSPDGYNARYNLLQRKPQAPVQLLPLPEDRIGLYTVFSRPAAERFLARYEQALQAVSAAQPYASYLEARVFAPLD